MFTALALLAVAFALRAATFGNPNVLADDAFYALVGERMHAGAIPYVTIWDRKPFGLFALYWALAGIWKGPLGWQVAATLSAAGTAMVLAAIVRTGLGDRPLGARAGLLAGLAYLFGLAPLDGLSGQSPVFYNLLVAGAAWLALREDTASTPRAALAALLCGLAVTIKQTALFEGAFLCLWLLWSGWREGHRGQTLTTRALAIAAGAALPMAAIGAGYAAIGHWDAWWQAMVTSNLAKAPLVAGEAQHGAASLAVRIAPLTLAALAGLAIPGAMPRRTRAFLVGWLLAALAGFLAVPHFFPHYALPALVPLGAAAGGLFASPRFGRIAFAAVALWALVWDDPIDRGWHARAIASTQALASAAVHHDGGRPILVYDGPVYLYAMTNSPLPSPLVFPHHLNQLIERDVSQFDTDAEVARVLANHPGAVVTTLAPRNFPVNAATWRAVQAYVRSQCRMVALVPSWDRQVVTPTAVWGDCAPSRVPVRSTPVLLPSGPHRNPA